MTDRSELRRLAEAVRALRRLGHNYVDALRDMQWHLDEETVLALCDAAERAEQATELLRELREAYRYATPDMISDDIVEELRKSDVRRARQAEACAQAEAFLAEVDGRG